MALILITAPAAEPVTLAEAKLHLKVDGADDDALITTLVTAARRFAERFSRRALVTQTWDLVLDAFPADDGAIFVPRPQLQSVTSITYIDGAGSSQVLAASKYKVDIASQPGRIAPAFGQSWPATRAEMTAVTARFVAGYGAASDVPESIKQAILLLLAHWYENREAVHAGTGAARIPLTVEALLRQHRVLTL